MDNKGWQTGGDKEIWRKAAEKAKKLQQDCKCGCHDSQTEHCGRCLPLAKTRKLDPNN